MPQDDVVKLVVGSSGEGITLTASPYNTEGLSLAVIGNKGSGKSHTLAVLAEEAYRNRIPFVFYDVNGDAASLRELGEDVLVIGRRQHAEPARCAHYSIMAADQDPDQYINLALDEGFSIVFDLSGMPTEEKCQLFARFAHRHFVLAEAVREPVMVLVDEAHQFAPQKRSDDAQRYSLNTLTAIMSDGRKRGILLAIATQRSAYLNKDVLFGMNVRLFGKITWFPDYESVKPYLPPGVGFDTLRNLQTGNYYIVSPNAHGQIVVKGRVTSDLGSTPVMSRRRDRERPSVKQLQLFDGAAGEITVKRLV